MSRLALLSFLLLGVATLAVGAARWGAGVKILDAHGGLELDVAQLARYFCWNNKDSSYQIQRLDTVDRLIDYLESLPVEHQFSSCASKRLPMLYHLQVLLKAGNENVCDDVKVSLIEHFHNRFISERRPATSPEVPKVIKYFFLQYASFVAQLCAIRSNDFFDPRLTEFDYHPIEDLDSMLDRFSQSIDLRAPLRSYNDIFLVWGILRGFPKSLSSKLTQYIRPAGEKRLFVKMSKTEGLRYIQAICKNTLRPLYSQTMLPVVRLIDLGYYPRDRDFLKVINEQPFVTRVFKLMLLCETFLPIQAIEARDDQPLDQIYLVKPKELVPDDERHSNSDSDSDSDSEDDADDPAYGMEDPERVPLAPLAWEGDVVPSITAEDAKRRIKRIKEDLEERREGMARVTKFIIRGMKNAGPQDPKSRLILSETNERFGDVADECLNRVDLNALDAGASLDASHQDSDSTSAGDTTSLSRRKRGVGSVAGKVVGFIGGVLLMAVALVACVIKVILYLLYFIGVGYTAVIGGIDAVYSVLLEALVSPFVNIKKSY